MNTQILPEAVTGGTHENTGILSAEAGVAAVQPPVHTRKTYATPRLELYGRLADLTQSASTGANGDGGAGMMIVQSDRAAKTDIVRIGTHPLGCGLYVYTYRPQFRQQCGPGRHFGVLAQEVEALLPAAVSRAANGYLQVDYGMLGIVPGGTFRDTPLH